MTVRVWVCFWTCSWVQYTGQFLHQYHSILITVVLEYVWISESVSLPPLFFGVYVLFESACQFPQTQAAGILTGTALNL